MIELLSPLITGKFNRISFEYKHFFSGAALFANGKICMTLTPVGLALKLPEQLRESLIKEEGAKKLRYFPKAPIKKDYVVLPKNLMNDQSTFNNIIEVCVNYAANN
ncbi:MAG: TfoX/Sxy family protein [Candidatus Marinimicrobia bacterium]|nr:TfoX/Sxy family protein [Candidatus Neomarinimicrobiota bacterium]